ncbi:hypothetical protein DPEC_G00188710 [Dallia pectoralis]|uniref:Uncharacterized protein n=1 Tax=Dallia pectoralis TaxID=75939 RepID=A0ACC2GC06_DALPE|nr:hypothetical protein DPEC_G00188710 [Dallia pectoralis]
MYCSTQYTGSSPPLQGDVFTHLGHAIVELSESTSKNTTRSVKRQRTREAQKTYLTGTQEPLPTSVVSQHAALSPRLVVQGPLGFRYLTMVTAIKLEDPYRHDTQDTLMPPMVPEHRASIPPLEGDVLTHQGHDVEELSETTT